PRERREESDTDVHRAVADREDPPVARQAPSLAVPDVEMALDPWFVVSGAAEVAPDRHPERIGAVAGGAEHAAEPGVRPVRNHYIARADRLGRPLLFPVH